VRSLTVPCFRRHRWAFVEGVRDPLFFFLQSPPSVKFLFFELLFLFVCVSSMIGQHSLRPQLVLSRPRLRAKEYPPSTSPSFFGVLFAQGPARRVPSFLKVIDTPMIVGDPSVRQVGPDFRGCSPRHLNDLDILAFVKGFHATGSSFLPFFFRPPPPA